MKLLNYFTNGQRDTLKFKDRAALSFKGEPITVYSTTDTVIDRFFVGEFTSATYSITVEYDSNKKEAMQVGVVVRPGEASVLIYGRTGLDDELITLSGTVNESFFSLTARSISPAYNGARIIHYVTYAENFITLETPVNRGSLTTQPSLAVSTSNVKFRPVVSNSGFKSPGFNVSQTGELTIASLSSTGAIIATGAVTASALTAPTINSTTVNATTLSATTSVTTDAMTTNTLVANSTAITGDLTVSTGTTNITSATTGTMNNVAIGATAPATAKFTSAELTQDPTAKMQVTTKKYVDLKASALAIALGS